MEEGTRGLMGLEGWAALRLGCEWEPSGQGAGTAGRRGSVCQGPRQGRPIWSPAQGWLGCSFSLPQAKAPGCHSRITGR